MQVKRLDISEAYAMREVLEVPAERWAAECGQPQVIARMRTAHDRLLERSKQEPIDFDQLQLMDVAFHQSIVEAAGNQFLSRPRVCPRGGPRDIDHPDGQGATRSLSDRPPRDS